MKEIMLPALFYQRTYIKFNKNHNTKEKCKQKKRDVLAKLLKCDLLMT